MSKSRNASTEDMTSYPTEATEKSHPTVGGSWSTRFKETNTFFALEVVAVLAGLIGVGLAVQEFRQAAVDREQEGIARAWASLTSAAPGNTGKVQALEYLAPRILNLEGIDLSCAAMGGLERRDPSQLDEGETQIGCPKPTYLHGLLLDSTSVSNGDISLRNADFEDADLGAATFKVINLYNANLAFSNLFAASFEGSNISYAVFRGAYFAEHANFEESWAWVDNPPYELNPAYGPQYFCEFSGDDTTPGKGLNERARRVRDNDTECNLNPDYKVN